MKKKYLLMLTFVTAAMFTACGNKDAAPVTAEDTTQVTDTVVNVEGTTEASESTVEISAKEAVPEQLTYETREITEEIPYDEEGVVLIESRITYPEFKGDFAFAQSLNSKISQHVEEFRTYVEEGKQYAIEDYEYRMEEKAAWVSYTMEQMYSVVYESADYLVIAMQSYEYTGGAHGSAATSFINIDKLTGNEVTLEDMLEMYQTNAQKVTEYLIELSKGDDYKAAGQSIFFEGYEEFMSSVVAEGTWHFAEDGIIFFSNQYLLAPYAAGTQEFLIPYADMEAFGE